MDAAKYQPCCDKENQAYPNHRHFVLSFLFRDQNRL